MVRRSEFQVKSAGRQKSTWIEPCSVGAIRKPNTFLIGPTGQYTSSVLARATMLFDLDGLKIAVPGLATMNVFGTRYAGPNQNGIVVRFRNGTRGAQLPIVPPAHAEEVLCRRNEKERQLIAVAMGVFQLAGGGEAWIAPREAGCGDADTAKPEPMA